MFTYNIKKMNNADNQKLEEICETMKADDSYITVDDKKNLLLHIKKMYKMKFPWCDDVLLKILIKKHYNEVVKNMNRKDYLNEKEKEDVVDYLVDDINII